MRRSTTWLIAMLALAHLGPALAGTLYVCKGPNGVKAYQDTPCPSTAKSVGTGTFKSTPYAPPSAVPPDQPRADATPAAVQQPPLQVATMAATEPVGWICETSRRRWLQFSPCPATYMRAAPVSVNGVIATTGAPVHGTGTVGVPTPVQSTPLDRDGVCAALGDRSIRVQHSGSSDVYERNKLKSTYCY